MRGNGNDGTRITVRDLLGQTSGLNDYLAVSPDAVEAFTPEGYRRSRFRSQTPRDQVAAALSRPPQWLPDPLDSPDRTRRWGYSNTNYILMGLVIEEVTGHPWAQEIHDRIIEPLDLRHTFSPGTSPMSRPRPPPRTRGFPARTASRTRRWRTGAAPMAA